MNQVRSSFVFAALAAITCAEPDTGDLSAHKTGTIITDLAPREAPDAEFSLHCGTGALTDAGKTSLARRPFVQQDTSHGALIVFQTEQTQSQEVDVTTLDGTHVATVSSEADPSVSVGHQQIARISGLAADTSYCYALRGLTTGAGFRTAPDPGTAASIRFAAFGDSGSGNSDQYALLHQLATAPFDFIVHTGDLAYEGGSAGELERTVFRVYAPLMQSFALYPVPGNHDYETAGAAPFLQAFVLPEDGDPDWPERWYSFDWGDVHFVGLDTERIGDRQAEWLDADLMQNHLPWTIVFGHRPPFSSGEHGGDAAFREHFVPVLERYQVPLVLSGHDHDYERTQVLNGVTYVVTGGGGRGTRNVGESSFTAFSEAVIHFVFVEIAGSRLVLHAIDGVGREFDQTVIERSADE
jgi:acid phosphatase type 7